MATGSARLSALGGDLSEGHLFFRRDIDGVWPQKLHVCVQGHPRIAEMLRFRRHLRRDATARDNYPALKPSLKQQNKTGIGEYLQAKVLFVHATLEILDAGLALAPLLETLSSNALANERIVNVKEKAMRLPVVSALAVVGVVACQGATEGAPDPAASFAAAPCTVGVYGPAGSFVAITRRGDTFRYSFSDGRYGNVAAGASVECSNNAVRVGGTDVLEKRDIRVTDTVFDANGARLAGQLLEPEGAGATTPLVALAHGSEELGWIEAASYPYQLVGRGVSVFVYDKRGTGRSTGEYSQNFPELSDDLVAASAEAKHLAAGRFGRFGLLGFSQGGWIAPLAATRAGAEFIGIGYGLVVDILEEDAAQVQLELTEAGFDDAVLDKARQATDITARLAVSGYTDGLADLARFQDQYGDEAWFQRIRGGFSGVILGMSTEQLRDEGIPMFDRLKIDWSIKPMDVLRTVNVPQLWVLAEQDREAPVATTLSRLQALREEGKDITVFAFPDTDHGMREYTQAADGTRQYLRVTAAYYDLIADWASGALRPPYADSSER